MEKIQRLTVLLLSLCCLLPVFGGCRTEAPGENTVTDSLSERVESDAGSPAVTENDGTEAPETVVETEPAVPDTKLTDVTVVSGDMKIGDSYTSKAQNTLAILGDYKQGQFSVTIRPGTNGKVGLIFGYRKTGEGESYYRFTTGKSAEKVSLEYVENGDIRRLYENYLSVGHNVGASYRYRIILSGDAAYCYLGDLMYTFIRGPFAGAGIGLYASASGTVFSDAAINEGITAPIRKDTLIIGHSYLEGWTTWSKSLAGTVKTYHLGDTVNLGISGSWASHWYEMRDCLALYRPKTVIFMIGINDLLWGGVKERMVVQIRDTLQAIRDQNPEMEAVLFTINHCPLSDGSGRRSSIAAANRLLRDICDKNRWIHCADIEYGFCDADNVPMAHWFSDGLHPTRNGYTLVIVPALRKALEARGQ